MSDQEQLQGGSHCDMSQNWPQSYETGADHYYQPSVSTSHYPNAPSKTSRQTHPSHTVATQQLPSSQDDWDLDDLPPELTSFLSTP